MSKFAYLITPLILVSLSACSTFYAGVSAYEPGFNRVSTAADGSKGFEMPLFPVAAKVEFVDFMLAGDYTVLPRKSPDGQEKSTYILSRALWAPNLGGSVEFLLGPAVNFHRQSGTGTSVVLNNGSSTATFGTPSYSVTTSIVAIDAGFGFKWNHFYLSTECLVEAPGGARLNLAALVGLSYGFGKGTK